MILLLLPWSGCEAENNQEIIQTQTNSGGWEQEWIGGFGRILDVEYSPDASRIVVAGSSVIHILNASTYGIEKQLSSPNRKIYSAAFSPDGNRIVSADGTGNVEIWYNYEEEKTFSVSNNAVLSVCWSPDGKRIATGDDEGHI
jgi:WD40 repeat protein